MAHPDLPASADAPATLPIRERLPLRTVLAYATPIFGLSSTLFIVQFFFLKFGTDVLLLPPVVVGGVFAVGRVWDAVSDPIVGTWSDRTRTVLGRRRPWMLGAIPVLGLTVWMVWSPPALTGAALTAWVTIALLAYYTAFTAYGVPHQSLGAELSQDHHERSRIFGVHNASFTLGMMCAFGGMQYVMNAPDPRAAASWLALPAVGVVALVLLIPPLLIRERPEYQGRGGIHPVRAMRDVLQNPHARLLLTAQFIQMSGAGVLGILAPYLLEYVVRRPDLVGPMPAIFVICSILSIPVWLRVARKFGKRNAWVTAMLGTGVSFGCITFVAENDLVLMGVILVFAGFFSGCGGAIGPSILADVIDADEYETGERKEGAYTAAWGFAIKSASALIILFTSVVLQFSGFQPNVEQTPTTLWILRLLNGALPLVMFCFGAFVFRRFALNAREHSLIRQELDRRQAART